MIKTHSLSSSEIISWSIIDFMMVLLASSTIAYEIILFSRLPLWMLTPLWCFWLIILFLLRYKITNKQLINFKLDIHVISLFILGIFCALINIFTLRPDADDFSFLHRAVFGLIDLNAPIAIHHTAHDLTNLPAISPVHLTTSIEVVTTFVAHVIGIQPIAFVHNGIGSLCLFIFPFVLYNFFRYLKFSQRQSLIGICITILLYSFSGDSHQDWGNFTLVRAWQGKTILITLFVPLTALLTFRFLRLGKNIDLLRLNLAVISGLGLSGTAFFLLPFIGFFSILGSAIYQYKHVLFYKKTVWIGSVLIPFSLVFILIKVGVLPEIKNTEVWNLEMYGLSNKGRAEIIMLERTVFVTKTTVWFYIISISSFFLFHKPNLRIRSLIYSSIFICIALVLPPVSSVLIKITMPGAYWRLAYASQLLLVISIFILSSMIYIKKQTLFLKGVTYLCRRFNIENINDTTKLLFLQKLNNITLKIVAVCIVAGFILLKTSSINSTVISKPTLFKFSDTEINVVKLASQWVPQYVVALIPEELVSALGLLRPDIRMIATRNLETQHVLLNANYDKKIIEIKLEAQRDLQVCGKKNKIKILMTNTPKLALLVFPKTCTTEEILANLSINKSAWTVKRTDYYQIWLKI